MSSEQHLEVPKVPSDTLLDSNRAEDSLAWLPTAANNSDAQTPVTGTLAGIDPISP